jgi:hypothetical protein
MFAAKGPHAGISSGGTPSASPAASNENDAAGARGRSALPFEADVPGDWKPGSLNQLRVAAYNVGVTDDGRSVEMTVIPLAPGSGDLKSNVDRWRKEVGLSETTAGELEEVVKSIEIEGEMAEYVHLIGPESAKPREATLGVILRRPDQVWYFKLRGPMEVVEREKQHFEEYVQSVKFK